MPNARQALYVLARAASGGMRICPTLRQASFRLREPYHFKTPCMIEFLSQAYKKQRAVLSRSRVRRKTQVFIHLSDARVMQAILLTCTVSPQLLPALLEARALADA
jgi:hypothetical protein